jgi:hypothetical protein
MRLLSLTLVLLMFIFFSACKASWQYISLESHEVTKDTLKHFIWENDTLRLVYSYNGWGGPVHYSITNKTDKPMYVNWKKSAIIRFGIAHPLFQSDVQMTGAFDASRGYRGSAGIMAASFSLPEGMDFIPPGSSIDKNMDVYVLVTPAGKDALSGLPTIVKDKKSRDFTEKYKKYTFDQASSPMQFKSYLTFLIERDNSREFAVSHTFYAHEIAVARYSPRVFNMNRGQADLLYLKEYY